MAMPQKRNCSPQPFSLRVANLPCVQFLQPAASSDRLCSDLQLKWPARKLPVQLAFFFLSYLSLSRVGLACVLLLWRTIAWQSAGWNKIENAMSGGRHFEWIMTIRMRSVLWLFVTLSRGRGCWMLLGPWPDVRINICSHFDMRTLWLSADLVWILCSRLGTWRRMPPIIHWSVDGNYHRAASDWKTPQLKVKIQ